MDVKEAVTEAKRYISDVFSDEGIEDIGLEEVEFDDSVNIWAITMGFSRLRQPLDHPPFQSSLFQPKRLVRSYKIVRISDLDKKVISVKNREPVE
jgi:hypothetical protein